ncbi:MAG TPA: hypothetical protein VFJ90_06630 [Candidatus Didemnitutus sp.]|nr:hypothetical protein [Candidatus Didemnitutus sp.]
MKPTFPRIAFIVCAGALALLLAATSLHAAIVDVLLERFQKSEFAFGRVDSNTPFPPVAWVSLSSYNDSRLATASGAIHFEELGFSQALVLPVWIGRKDMFILGEYFAWQQIDFTSPRPQRVHITTVMPVVAWLRQTGPHRQFAAFVTPELVNGGGYADHGLAKSGGYAGAIAVNWTSDTFAWFYGLVGLFEPGNDTYLPYLGILWQPTREWSVSLIMPWPSISYAPTPDFMFQLGLLPAEATLTTGQEGRNLRVSYDSWNLMFSANRRLSNVCWVTAAVGWASLASFSIDSSGNSGINNDLKRGVLWTLQVSLRPPTNAPGPRGASR